MELRTELGPEPVQVSHARQLVTDQLAQWSVDRKNTETTVLLVSELVTNALMYGGPPVHLSVGRTPGGIRVEVHDGTAGAIPILRRVRPDLPGGRGMHLVDTLSDRWGTDRDSAGKAVWFELDLHD